MAPNFSLQSVLDYRHTRVELLEVELGQLLQAHRRGQTFLEALQSSRGRICDELQESQQGELDLFLLGRLQSSLRTVNGRIVEQQLRLEELAGEVENKRLEVVDARQGEESLAILKRKEIERYEEEQLARDSRLQDDIYNTQAYRRSSRLA